MYQPHRKNLIELEMWGDLAACGGALLLASGLRTQPFWRKEVLLVQHPARQAAMILALLCAWHLSLVIAGLYRSFRLARHVEQLVAIGRAVALTTACTGVWLVLHTPVVGGPLRWTGPLGVELTLAACFTAALLLLSREASLAVTRWVRKQGRNLRYCLIVGTNDRSILTANRLTTDRGLGYRLLGFVDDRWYAENVPAIYRPMLVGRLSEIAHLLRTLALDEVIITLPLASAYADVRDIYDMCRQQGILARCEVSLFSTPGAGVGKHGFSLQFTSHNQSVWGQGAVSVKRLLDICVALLALIAACPLLAAIAVAIKLTSHGPVFFLQERLGLGKRRFKICKFRTMVVDAEQRIASLEHLNQSAGPTFKLKGDPRITPIGSFLRKTSLDELPQLLNVLLGDMSLVGPRPLPLRDCGGFSEDWHRRRFSVKPGITCLWQITGRSTIGFDQWMELDMNYIDSWSIWLDLKILCQTIPAVLRGSGAM